MKLAIVINGAGGVGKDTLCMIAAKKYKVRNVSSITPIKEIASLCGWCGEKSDRARKFLSDLKRLTIEYSDFPTQYLTKQYAEFLATDEEILFVHIREPEEIAKFVRATGGAAKTLLIRGGERARKQMYGNAADDGVENYYYDYYFDNDKSLEEAEVNFTELIRRILEGDDLAD